MQRLKRNVSLGERIYRYRGSRDFEAAATRALIVFTLAAAGVASYIQYASSQGTLGARSATPSISPRATASASSRDTLSAERLPILDGGIVVRSGISSGSLGPDIGGRADDLRRGCDGG